MSALPALPSSAAQRGVQLGLLGFLALTALAGGVGLVSGAIPTDEALLAGSPFDSYRLPGVALFGVGVLAALATALEWRRVPLAPATAAIAGNGIVIFEAVEVVVIGFHVLQAIYIAIGCAIIALAWDLPPRR